MDHNWPDFFVYHPDGYLLWRERPIESFKTPQRGRGWNTEYANTRAGCEVRRMNGSSGYDYITFKNKLRPAHRMIWEYRHGPIPKGAMIDHINGNHRDNRIENLRLTDKYGNARNKFMPPGETGIMGVRLRRDRPGFHATLKAAGRIHRSGGHKTKGLAAVAYAKMSLRYHGKFSPYYRPKR